MEVQHGPEAIYSAYGGDPELGELVELFVREMPDRVAKLEEAFSRGDVQAVRFAAHQMKGAAGSYGFAALTPPAGALEQVASGDRPEAEIRRALDELTQLCRQVRPGIPDQGH